MSQTAVSFDQAVASAGLIADLANADIFSRTAEEDIPFGRYTVLGTDPEKQVLLPTAITDIAQPQVLTITLSADLVASNTINGKINNLALATTTFATDNDTTLAAVATLIQANANVSTAVASGTAPNQHVITVTAADPSVNLVLTDFIVAAGASQATVTINETTASGETSTGFGITVRDLARENDSSATVTGYDQYDTAAIMVKGNIYVQVEDAVTAGEPVYVRYTVDTGKYLGAFRSDTDSGKAAKLPNAVYMTDAAIAGYAVVRIKG